MSVCKYRAFMFLDQPPPWVSRTRLSTTFISDNCYYAYIQLVTFRRYIHYVHEHVTVDYRAIPLLFASPFLHSLLLPIRLPFLTWNPPCCDRIRPPRSQVARKLIFPFPSPGSYTPHSKIPTPRGFPDPNIHSLGRHRESGSQEPVQEYSILLIVSSSLLNWRQRIFLNIFRSERYKNEKNTYQSKYCITTFNLTNFLTSIKF